MLDDDARNLITSGTSFNYSKWEPSGIPGYQPSISGISFMTPGYNMGSINLLERIITNKET